MQHSAEAQFKHGPSGSRLCVHDLSVPCRLVSHCLTHIHECEKQQSTCLESEEGALRGKKKSVCSSGSRSPAGNKNLPGPVFVLINSWGRADGGITQVNRVQWIKDGYLFFPALPRVQSISLPFNQQARRHVTIHTTCR